MFFGSYTWHHLPNLWHRQVFIAVFAHSRSMWKERVLRMTRHQSGLYMSCPEKCNAYPGRWKECLCYANGQWSQFTFSFLSTTVNRNTDEKPVLCRYRFVDLFLLNYSKEKSGVSEFAVPGSCLVALCHLLENCIFATLERKDFFFFSPMGLPRKIPIFNMKLWSIIMVMSGNCSST